MKEALLRLLPTAHPSLIGLFENNKLNHTLTEAYEMY